MECKTIVLIDFENGGHREAFMQFFSKSLLELGHKVICIMPDTLPIQHWIANNVNAGAHNILFYDKRIINPASTSFGRFNESVSRIIYWKRQKNILSEIEKESNQKIDLVFFNWLDNQMANYLPPFIIDAIFPYKWSGVYFHPVIFRIRPHYLDNKTTLSDVDSVFLAKNCIAVTLHDEGILEKYQKRIGKKTMLFPETADGTPPNQQHVLANKIKEKAQNRTIVGIIGLEPHKGAFTLMRLAKIADQSKFFFAFTGVFKSNSLDKLSTDEKKEVTDFIANIPNNCIWETGGLQEGEDYNSVFCSFDIIHIVYNNFYSSSNRLTKAAIFNKLVLGSNVGCVGEDVPKYNLGATANENNIEEQYQKLQLLRNNILSNNFPTEQWKNYADKHSTDRLPEKFNEILKLL
jgi:hypothetical protein